jgi:chorismate dehydratase
LEKEIRIALVQYLNTLPFQWALEKLDNKLNIVIHKVPPSECASLLVEGKVDLSLIPLGAIDDLPNLKRATDYGIACDGPVRTVCLFSDQPISTVKKLYLDIHSRTSQKLAQILFEVYWKIDVNYEIRDVSSEFTPGKDEAVLMIGDKVFKNENRFKYRYDLGEIWKEKTGLPFVFAAWMYAGENPVSESFIQRINTLFKNEISELENNLRDKLLSRGYSLDLEKYFQKNISYHLGKSKRMGMQLFLEKASKLRDVEKMMSLEKSS